jgi:hypothetical protein
MFTYPFCDWAGDSVAALFVAVAVGLFCAVGFPSGVIVGPSHKSFTFQGCKSPYCHLWLGDEHLCVV